MGGRSVALLVFLSSSLLNCLAERVSIHLTDFADGEENAADEDGANGADVSGSLSAMRPALDKKKVGPANVLDYVLGEGHYAEGQKWEANQFKGNKEADFYSELLKNQYKSLEDYDYSKGREHHKKSVLGDFTLIIGRVWREKQKKIMAEKKNIMDGQDEAAKADVENVAHSRFSWHAQFVTGLPGALRPSASEAEAHLAQNWGEDLVLVNWDDVVTLFVGNAALYKRASDAGLIHADLLEDAHQLWPEICETVRRRHVNALFVSPTLKYESEVKPFVVSESPNDYAQVCVTYVEVGCPSSAATCSFEEKADLTGDGVDADDVWQARLSMIKQAKEVKAQGGLPFAFKILNDAEPTLMALDEQPIDRDDAEGYPLSYKV